MAFIYKSDGQGKCSLSYAELADLYSRAKSDAGAAIQFECLPDAEKRLAKSLVKTFTGKGKAAKAKKPKPVTKPQWSMADMLTADLDSPDPSIRETARRLASERK